MKKIGYKRMPAQKKFHKSKKKYRLYSGAFRAGKTKAGCNEGIYLSIKIKGNRGLIGRKDYPDLRDTTQKTFFEELKIWEEWAGEPLGDPNFGKSEGIAGFRKQENIYKFSPYYGGSEILFRQLKEPEDYKSLELGWFYLDEGTETTLEMWNMLSSRLSMPKNPRLCGFITTNPDTPSHWIHRLFYDQDPPNPDYFVVETSTYDNVQNLPDDYVEGLERQFDEDYARRYLKGQWTVMSGLIYKEFNRAVNVIPRFEIPDEWMKIRGIDFGYSNPFVCLWVAVDGDGRAYLYREYVKAQTLLDSHAVEIEKPEEKISVTVGDPSAKQERQELINRGIPVVGADNTVNVGIQNIKARLKVQGDGKPRLFIFDDCVTTLKEFGTYKWKVVNGEPTEEPVKVDDHCCDALRYIINYVDKGSNKAVFGRSKIFR